PLRDPRADPCGRRPGDHLVGAVESAECVPARLAATEAGRRVGGGTGPLQPRRPLIGPTVKPPVRRAPPRAATRRCSRRCPRTRAYISMSSFLPAVQEPAYAMSTLTRSAASAI